MCFSFFLFVTAVFAFASFKSHFLQLYNAVIFSDVVIHLTKFGFYRIILVYSFLHSFQSNLDRFSTSLACNTDRAIDFGRNVTSRFNLVVGALEQEKLSNVLSKIPLFKPNVTYQSELDHGSENNTISKMETRLQQVIKSKIDAIYYFDALWDFVKAISLSKLLCTNLRKLIQYRKGEDISTDKIKTISFFDPFVIQFGIQIVMHGDSWVDKLASSLLSPTFERVYTLEASVETHDCYEDIVFPSVIKVFLILFLLSTGLIVGVVHRILKENKNFIIMEADKILITLRSVYFNPFSLNRFRFNDIV